MKKKITLITVILMMLINLFPFNIKALDNDVSINEFDLYSEGFKVSNIKLSTEKELPLNAEEEFDDNTTFQWQILNVENDWIDISGESGVKINVNYLMVKEMLKDGETLLRLKTSDGNREFSKEVSVSVSQDTNELEESVEDKDNINEELEKENITYQTEVTNDNEYDSVDKFEVRIQYLIKDKNGNITIWDDTNNNYSRIAPCFIIETISGQYLTQTVDSPTIPGYTPNQSTVRISKMIEEPEIISVIYSAVEVEYKINHLQQKLGKEVEILDDNYETYETTVHYGKTGDLVASDLAKKYEGFETFEYKFSGSDQKYNYHRPEIAADGSTEVNIYYIRKYFLLDLDLDGGYGTKSIYAPYGTLIENVSKPIKPGHEFIGWRYGDEPITNTELPAVMPANNRTYTAVYVPENPQVDVRLIFWHQDADDLKKYYIASQSIIKVDLFDEDKNINKVQSSSYKNYNLQARKDYEHFEYDESQNSEVEVNADGSAIVNVYYKRKPYTIRFYTQNLFNIKTLSAEYTGIYGSIIPDNKIKSINALVTDNNKWYKNGQVIYLGKFDNRVMGYNASYIDGGIGITPYSTIVNYCLKDDLNSTNCNEKQSSLFQTRALNLPISESETPKLTNDEVFKNIKGYTRNKSSFFFDGLYKPTEKTYNIDYIKNKHKIIFYNYNEFLTNEEKIYAYDEVVSNLNKVHPNLPKNLESESLTFKGWYTNSKFEKKFDFDKAFKMPDNDIVLFAKWEKNKHELKFVYEYETHIKDSDNIVLYELEHGSKLSIDQKLSLNNNLKIPDGNKFITWYYKEGDKEIAFNEDMTITDDLVLYPKFIKNNPYNTETVLNITFNQDLGDTVSGFIGQTITVNASLANQACTDGYFPLVLSKSVILTKDEQPLNFEYKQGEVYEYTVLYEFYESNGETQIEEPIIPNKTVTTYNKVITEIYIPVEDFTPVDFIKTLDLTANEDKIVTFKYIKEPQKTALVKFNYHIEKLTEANDIEYESFEIESIETEFIKDISESLNIESLINISALTGFTLAKINDQECVTDNCNYIYKLPAEGLTFDLYFNRDFYEYTVNYKYKDSENVENTIFTKKDRAKYEKEITADSLKENIEELKDYTYDSTDQETLTIRTDRDSNIINLYYAENKVNIIYKVEGEAGSGTVSLGEKVTSDIEASEDVKVLTGMPLGAIATANKGYRFAGWCMVPGCHGSELESHPNLATVDKDNKILPKIPLSEIIKSRKTFTFYAVFVKDVADLKITKTLKSDVDEAQSFLFNIKGISDQTNNIDLTVAINIESGNIGELIIEDLPTGQYTITNLDHWSWNYKSSEHSITNNTQIELKYNKNIIQEVRFSSKSKELKWLNGDSYNSFSFQDLINKIFE